ncbi:hypothetical protein TNCV_2845191 [Trichonephila clavipes]|nr:hypothetical protein TNCV_2845191 [Trichonephila clavipes]
MGSPAKVLEVRLLFSEPILNTFGRICNSIIIHDVSVNIRVKMYLCMVPLIWQYSEVFHGCLLTRTTSTTFMSAEHATYQGNQTTTLTVRVEIDGFMAS